MTCVAPFVFAYMYAVYDGWHNFIHWNETVCIISSTPMKLWLLWHRLCVHIYVWNIIRVSGSYRIHPKEFMRTKIRYRAFVCRRTWPHTYTLTHIHNYIHIYYAHIFVRKWMKLCQPLCTTRIYTHTNGATEVIIALRWMELCLNFIRVDEVMPPIIYCTHISTHTNGAREVIISVMWIELSHDFIPLNEVMRP